MSNVFRIAGRSADRSIEIPAPPADMDVDRGERWRLLAQTMARLGIAFEGRADLMRLYVVALDEAELARRHVDEHGAIVAAPRTGNPVPNPYRRVAVEAERAVMRLGIELGLTRRRG